MNLYAKFPKLVQFLSHFFAIKVVETKGEFTDKVVVTLRNGKFLLDTPSVNYSYGTLKEVFFQAFNKLQINTKPNNQVLILGFGAGSIASILQDDYKQQGNIVGVEFDGVVIQLAKRYFSLDRFKNLELIHFDAFEYVKNCQQKFDLIAIDLFIEDQTQDLFATKQFIEYLKPLLNAEGLIVYNRMISSVETEIQAREISKYFEQVFGASQMIKFDNGGGHNWFVVNRQDF